MKPDERVIIVGGPRRGKSTLAQELVNSVWSHPAPWVIHHRCGDPLSKVKDPLPQVEYLPEGIPISGDDGAAQWVADNWFSLPGPWVCEGWVMARALRRWLADYPHRDATGLRAKPADRIIVLAHDAWVDSLKGQESMHKAVMTVWGQIAHNFAGITEVRTGERLGHRRP